MHIFLAHICGEHPLLVCAGYYSQNSNIKSAHTLVADTVRYYTFSRIATVSMLSLWPRICMLRTCYNPYFPRQVKSIYIYIYYVTKHASHFRGRPISKTHRVFPARCNLPSRRHVPDIRAQSTSPMAIELLESNLWNHNTNEQYGVNGMCRAINESCLGYIRKQWRQ